MMKLRNVLVEQCSENLYTISWQDGPHGLKLSWSKIGPKGVVCATYCNDDTSDFVATNNLSEHGTGDDAVATFMPTFDGAKYAGRYFVQQITAILERNRIRAEELRKKNAYEDGLRRIANEKAKAARRAVLKGGKGETVGEPQPLFKVAS